MPETLGELILVDRTKAGLTQGEVVSKLNKEPKRPKDPYTRRPKNFHQSWLQKLEYGQLRRELSVDIRKSLAEALGGNASLYSTLPIKSKGQVQLPVVDYDVLPLLRHIAKQDLQGLPFGELCKLCEAYHLCSEVGVSLIDPLAKQSDS